MEPSSPPPSSSSLKPAAGADLNLEKARKTLLQLETALNQVGYDKLQEIMETVRTVVEFNPDIVPAFKYKMDPILRPLLKLVNSSDFIKNLTQLQAYTTEPSWLTLLEPLLIANPLYKDRIVKAYRDLDFSEEFINKILLFPSGRPRVDLTVFMKLLNIDVYSYVTRPFDYVLTSYSHPYYISNAPDGMLTNIFAGVIRYQSGMSGYLVVPEDNPENKKWCGTFYYFEPSSLYLLYIPQALVTWNKITACLDLNISSLLVSEALYNTQKDEFIEQEDGSSLPVTPYNIGFRLPSSAKEVGIKEAGAKEVGIKEAGAKEVGIKEDGIREEWFALVEAYHKREIDPMVHFPGMYAVEDIFDQILCARAVKLGIDVIVLKYMTGANRVVTEILDTRDRVTSFQNIYLPPLLS